MRKRYILLQLFLIVQSAVCIAQQDRIIDSLLNALTNQKKDTSKVRTLIAISKRYRTMNADPTNSNILRTRNFAEDALLLAKELNFRTGIADSYIEIGFAHRENYPERLKSFYLSLQLRTEIGDKKDIAECYYYIGMCYGAQGNFPEQLASLFTALKISKEIYDNKQIYQLHLEFATTYNIQGNYPEALKSHLAALKCAEEMGNKKNIAAQTQRIGLFFKEQGDLPQALKYYLASIKTSKETGDKVSDQFIQLGQRYEVQGNYLLAVNYYQAALNISEEKETQFEGNQAIASYYLKRGEISTRMKNFSAADKFLNDALSAFKETGNKVKIKESYDRLTAMDIKMGNWEGAYQNYKMSILYRDSIANKENTEKIIRLQMQNEFEKKEDSLVFQQLLTDEELKQQILLAQQQKQALLLNEKELALINNEKQLQFLEMQKDSVVYAGQEAEAERKQGQFELLNKEKAIQTLELKKQKQLKKYLLAGLGLFLILTFFAYRNYRTKQQLKLQTLRNKIASDLHDDIGSTLSSISIFSQMAQQQSKETIPLLETIGENSRKMLDAMADIVWTINPENDQFENIVLRMRNFAYELLGAKNIDFEFNADEEVAKMKLSMDVRKNLYLIFKEATNNLVKYSGANKAAFNIKTEKDNLTMLISDNGNGFNQHQTTTGNGLKNMKKRAEEIRAQLMIHSILGNGTTIELKVAV